MKKFKKLSLFLILAALMVITAACGGAKEAPKDECSKELIQQLKNLLH